MRDAQKSSTPVPIGVTGPMPVTAMRRLSGTCCDLGPEDLHGLPDGRDVLELGIGHLDLEALLDGHDRAHQVDRVQPEVVEQVGLRRHGLRLDLQAVDQHLAQRLQNLVVALSTPHVALLPLPRPAPKDVIPPAGFYHRPRYLLRLVHRKASVCPALISLALLHAPYCTPYAIPPSTVTQLPVMYEALAQKRTASATSSGVPVRAIGMRSTSFSRCAAGRLRVMAVSTRPGTTTLAVTPWRATSLATDFVKPTSPAFAAAQFACPALPTEPATEPMLTIL